MNEMNLKVYGSWGRLVTESPCARCGRMMPPNEWVLASWHGDVCHLILKDAVCKTTKPEGGKNAKRTPQAVGRKR